MVTIEADEEVWRYLQVRKSPGDSNNDVLRRELGLDDECESEPESEPDAHPSPDTDAAIAAWHPPADVEVNTENAREALRQAVAWLREQDGARRKAEIVAGAYRDGPLSERIWWARGVRPGLQALDSVAVEGRKYRWAGDETAQSGR